jgi:hypothetical protein
VRKAGGVYYTPSYIVDYIVAKTVSKLVESRTPDQAGLILIHDPASGEDVIMMLKGRNTVTNRVFRASKHRKIHEKMCFV